MENEEFNANEFIEELRTVLSNTAKNDVSTSGIDKYRKELEEDTEITIHNIRDKSLRLPATQAKWVGYYVEEKTQLKRVSEIRQKYMASKTAKEVNTDAFAKLKTNAAPDEKLKAIDQVSYVRFASVYLQFQAVGDFEDAVNHVRENK